MWNGRLRAALLALLLCAAVAAPRQAAQGEGSGAPALGHLLIVSDIHFDPMAQSSLVDGLAAAPAERWRAILDGAADQSLGRFGLDTTWPLLRSALQAMRQALQHPDLVLIPGDFLAHHFRRSFDAAATRHGDADYRAFVAKTMRFLALQLRAAFPGVPILLALGNNDADCGDYRVQPGGPFLADTLPMVRDLAAGAAGDGFARDWAALGAYTAKLPRGPRLRALLLDDVFWSPHYRNACGSTPSSDPGKAALAWLERQLKGARAAGERVWLVLHIPPGVDPYTTMRRGGVCPGSVATMWTADDAAAFAALLHRYRDRVAAIVAGHTHMDDFRLIDADGFAVLVPALSPIFGQNPAFRTASYDAAGRLLDMTTWEPAAFPQGTAWKAEYSFAATWHLPAVDRASLARLDATIAASPAAQARWQRLYAVSSAVFWPLHAGLGESGAIRAYRCAERHVGAAAFRRCSCAE